MSDPNENVNPELVDENGRLREPQQVDDELVDDNRLYGNRLSLAILGCDPEGAVKDLRKNETKALALIYGRLRGLTEIKKLTDKATGIVRDSWGLTGQIEGINLVTGVVMSAPVFYFPSGIHEAFLTEMKVQLAQSPDTAEIEFAMEAHARPDGNPRGYSWVLFNRAGVKKNDPLAHLRRRALEASKAPMLLNGPSGERSAAD